MKIRTRIFKYFLITAIKALILKINIDEFAFALGLNDWHEETKKWHQEIY